MANLLVRDVPDGVHEALRRKAQRRHQSLQQFLSEELSALAGRRSISEVLEEIEGERGGQVGLEAAVTDLSEDRAAR